MDTVRKTKDSQKKTDQKNILVKYSLCVGDEIGQLIIVVDITAQKYMKEDCSKTVLMENVRKTKDSQKKADQKKILVKYLLCVGDDGQLIIVVNITAQNCTKEDCSKTVLMENVRKTKDRQKKTNQKIILMKYSLCVGDDGQLIIVVNITAQKCLKEGCSKTVLMENVHKNKDRQKKTDQKYILVNHSLCVGEEIGQLTIVVDIIAQSCMKEDCSKTVLMEVVWKMNYRSE